MLCDFNELRAALENDAGLQEQVLFAGLQKETLLDVIPTLSTKGLLQSIEAQTPQKPYSYKFLYDVYGEAKLGSLP